MFCLADEVSGDHVRICIFVGNDRNFGRPGEKVNAHPSVKNALGFSHKHFREGELHNWSASGTGTEIVGHSGSQEKTKTWMALLPGRKLGVVLMSNSEYANPRKLAARLLEVVMPRDSPPPGR